MGKNQDISIYQIMLSLAGFLVFLVMNTAESATLSKKVLYHISDLKTVEACTSYCSESKGSLGSVQFNLCQEKCCSKFGTTYQHCALKALPCNPANCSEVSASCFNATTCAAYTTKPTGVCSKLGATSIMYSTLFNVNKATLTGGSSSGSVSGSVSGTVIPVGGCIQSPSGLYGLIFQNGFLKLYSSSNLSVPVWISPNANNAALAGSPGSTAIFQMDNNLVIYNSSTPPVALWSSNVNNPSSVCSAGVNGCFSAILFVLDSGQVTISSYAPTPTYFPTS